MARRKSRRSSGRKSRRRTTRRYSTARYALKCGKRVVSRHRLKRAATRAKGGRRGCRIVKLKGSRSRGRRKTSRRKTSRRRRRSR